MDNIGRAASDTGTCCVLGVIGLALFIILIAYLLGHKKTVVTQQTSSLPPVIIREESRSSEWNETKQEAERRCPSCGRVIPEYAIVCPFCGKEFKSHFKEEYDDKEESEIEIEKEENFEESEEETPKFCSKCGSKLEEGLVFCTKCGKKL